MNTNETTEFLTIYKRPVELLQNLIRFNTTNPPGNEGECVAYINGLLTASGFETKILAKDPSRPNLLARLEGTGDSPPLLLQGHVDVVQTNHESWKHPPFEGKIVDGYVWGRGALDMKGGVAMMLSAFLRAKASGLKPRGDVILAVLCDEETGGKFGAKYLIEDHPEQFEGVRYAIGEFGGFPIYLGKQKFYQIQVTEKQRSRIRVIMKGPDGYGSILPPKGNASANLGNLLANLDKQCLPVHITPLPQMMIEAMSSALPFPRNMILRLLLNPRLTDHILKLLGEKGRTLHPLLHNTVNALKIEGGQTDNIMIPNKIEVNLSAYILPGYRPEDVIAELRKLLLSDADFEILIFEPVPGKPDMALYNMLAQILREDDPAGKPMPMILPAATDGRLFSRLGIQTYGFLPMNLPPDFNFSQYTHADNERIPVEVLDFGSKAIYKFLERYGNTD
jgi:acetylornithine deacetylase/succinyl-diaminopimelate desuccinylase-like protein